MHLYQVALYLVGGIENGKRFVGLPSLSESGKCVPATVCSSSSLGMLTLLLP